MKNLKIYGMIKSLRAKRGNLVLCLAFLALLLVSLAPRPALSVENTIWPASGLTGGGAALDGIDGSRLIGADGAIVFFDNSGIYEFYPLYLKDYVSDPPAQASPSVISPVTNPGNKRWLLAHLFGRGLTLYKADGTVIMSSPIEPPAAISFEKCSPAGICDWDPVSNYSTAGKVGITSATAGQQTCWSTDETSIESCGQPVNYVEPAGTESICRTGVLASGACDPTQSTGKYQTIEVGHASDTTIARGGPGVITIEGVTLTRTIGSGTATINPGAISSGACSSAIDGGTATGVATTDVITWNFNADPTSTTGWQASATVQGVFMYTYPTADHVNFKVCNNTGASITPGSLTVNWKVFR